MPTLGTRLRQEGAKDKIKHREPVWNGPEGDGQKGGITQSMLSRWLCCRERFRLRVVEGLTTADMFNHRMEYGQMWHTCEEAHAANKPIGNSLKDYAQQLCRRYPLQQEQVQHWYNVCKTQFPFYIQYWAKHPDVKDRTPLLQEQVFDVPYKLPSGRVVRLRGKWDSVDLIGKGKSAAVYLQENKSKGDIVEEQLKRQLGFDLQTFFYLIALLVGGRSGVVIHPAIAPNASIKGIRYNVIRRPLSGGKGSIRKHQPTKSNPAGETDEEFYARLGEVIMEDPPYWFMRWRVEVTSQDVERFKHEFLDNVLEELCNWWDWIDSPAGRKDPFADSIHFRLPYGIWNPLTENGSSEVDEYLFSGSMVGLQQGSKLFRELE